MLGPKSLAGFVARAQEHHVRRAHDLRRAEAALDHREPRFMLRALDASEVDVSAVREKDELKLQPDAQAFIDKDDTIAMASTLWRSL